MYQNQAQKNPNKFKIFNPFRDRNTRGRNQNMNSHPTIHHRTSLPAISQARHHTLPLPTPKPQFTLLLITMHQLRQKLPTLLHRTPATNCQHTFLLPTPNPQPTPKHQPIPKNQLTLNHPRPTLYTPLHRNTTSSITPSVASIKIAQHLMSLATTASLAVTISLILTTFSKMFLEDKNVLKSLASIKHRDLFV